MPLFALLLCRCTPKSRGLAHSPVDASQCQTGQWVTGWDGHATWSADGHVAFNRTGPKGPEWVVAAPPDYHAEITQDARVRWARFLTDRELAVVTQQSEGNATRHFLRVLAIPAATDITLVDLGLDLTDVLELTDEELIVLENRDHQGEGPRSAIRAYSLHGAFTRMLDLSATLGDSENFFFLEQSKGGFAVLSRVKSGAKPQATELPEVALYRVRPASMARLPIEVREPRLFGHGPEPFGALRNYAETGCARVGIRSSNGSSSSSH